MKNSLVHPVMYLFILSLTTLFLTAFSILSDINLAYPDIKLLGLTLKNLPVLVARVYPAACLVSLLLLFFRLVKKPGSRFLSFLLVFIVAAGTLIIGLMTLKILTEKVPARELSLNHYLPEQKIFINNTYTLYIHTLDEPELRDVIQLDTGAPAKEKFSYYPRATTGKQDNKLMLYLEKTNKENSTITLAAEPRHAALLAPHWSVAWFIRDFILLTRELDDFLDNYLNSFIFLCFALVFAILSCQVFLKITRWPLFNLLLLLILSRGLLFFYTLMRFEIITKILKLDSGSFFIRILPSLFLTGIGILFFIIDILFIPADFWQKEIEHE